MVDRFRVGNVAAALSDGLGLFISRRAEQEREASERAWELQLENIRTARRKAENEEQFMRQLALNAQQFTMQTQAATEREARADTRAELDRSARSAEAQADRQSRETIASEARGAQRDQFYLKMVADRRDSLNRTLFDMEELKAERLENVFDEGQRTAIEQEFEEQRDRTIGGFVMSMMDEAMRNPNVDAFAPFRVRTERDLISVFQNAGMSPGSAKTRATDMMKYLDEPAPGGRGATQDEPPPPRRFSSKEEEQRRYQQAIDGGLMIDPTTEQGREAMRRREAEAQQREQRQQTQVPQASMRSDSLFETPMRVPPAPGSATTAPLFDDRTANQRTMDNIIRPGMSALDEFLRGQKPRNTEDLYSLMGQRPGG